MIFYHIILLSIIQGLTEFLPVSSSGHLGLFHCFTDQCDKWDQENITLDIAVHVGTLGSVMLYFWRDVIKMLFGAGDIVRGRVQTDNARLSLFVLLGSVPVIIAGFILHLFEPDWLKTLYVISWTTLGFGVVLWWADKKFNHARNIKELTYKDAFLIGLAQMLALIPGTSRSGITMTAARFLGFTRTSAAHYSMLLSMVAIAGAGALISLDLIKEGNVELGINAAIAALLSFICGWVSIAGMMKFLEHCTFKVFALYRIILGGGLLILLYGGIIG